MNVFPAKHDKFQLPVWLNTLLLTLVKTEATAGGRAVFDPMSWRVFCESKSLYKANNSRAAAVAGKRFSCRYRQDRLTWPMTQTLFKGQLLLQKMNYVTQERLQKSGSYHRAHSPRSAKHYFKQVDADGDVMKAYRFDCYILNSLCNKSTLARFLVCQPRHEKENPRIVSVRRIVVIPIIV